MVSKFIDAGNFETCFALMYCMIYQIYLNLCIVRFLQPYSACHVFPSCGRDAVVFLVNAYKPLFSIVH